MSNYTSVASSNYDDGYEWSDWAWDTNENCYYRMRIDAQGQNVYEHEDSSNQSTTFDVPRSATDTTTSGLYSDYQSGGSQDYDQSEYRHNNYTQRSDNVNTLVDGFSRARISDNASSAATAFSPSRSSQSNEYPVSQSAPAELVHLANYQPKGFNVPTAVPEEAAQASEYQYGYEQPESFASSSRDRAGSSTSRLGGSIEDEGDDMTAMTTSRWDSESTRTMTPGNADKRIGLSEEESANREVGDIELLDPRYKVHESRKFKPFSVFMVLWPEPYGNPLASNTSDVTELTIREDKHGEKTHSKVRRFIVINSGDGHAQCVPITTYGRRGTKKHGISFETHAVVYMGKSPPKLRKGETKLDRAPLQINPQSPRDKLKSDSLVNYAKIYTVEHNVKVMFVGSVAKHCQSEFMLAVNGVWESRTRGNYE